jgi:hypothetical protein
VPLRLLSMTSRQSESSISRSGILRSGGNGVRGRRDPARNVDGDDIGTVDGHLDRNGAADAAGGAGDDGDPVLQHRAPSRANGSGTAGGSGIGLPSSTLGAWSELTCAAADPIAAAAPAMVAPCSTLRRI